MTSRSSSPGIVFCLFADDTGIFDDRHMLWELPRDPHLRGWLGHGAETGPPEFQVLDTPPDRRSPTLDADLAALSPT